jgi:hypothetical protein
MQVCEYPATSVVTVKAAGETLALGIPSIGGAGVIESDSVRMARGDGHGTVLDGLGDADGEGVTLTDPVTEIVLVTLTRRE